MSELRLRLLAIDDEYLIALDVQHILAPWEWCHVDIDTSRNLPACLAAEAAYDVVMVDPDALRDDLRAVIDAIRLSGAVPVFSTIDPLGEQPGNAPFAEVPRVLKPFAARPLMDAMLRALEPVQPVKAVEAAASFSSSGPKSESPDKSSSS